MRLPVSRLLGLLSSAALAALCIAPSAVRAEIVGTAGAVNPASKSTPPAGGARIIEIGTNVVHRERIQTSAQGSVQLVFVDKTSISIGPNSDLVIDEFVYDPRAGTGRMAATLAKGVMRFVGGNTSHTGGATVKTPAATLGIRGGVMTAAHNAQTGTRAINHFGRTTVATTSNTEVISRPDFGVNVALSGAATPPARVPPAELAGLTAQLTSRPGQTGGAPQRVTPAVVAQAGVGTAQATLDPPSTPSVQTQTAAGSTTTRTTAAAAVQQQTQVTQTIQQGTQTEAAQETAEMVEPPSEPLPPPPPPPPPPPTSTPRRFYAMTMPADPALGSGVPYLPAGFATGGTYSSSGVLGFGPGGSTSSGEPNTGTRFLQAGLNINGAGASQVSTIYLMTGAAYVSDLSGQNTLNGGFAATTRRSAGVSAGRAAGALTGLGSQVTFDSTYSPLSVQVNQDDVDANDQRVPRTAFYFPGGGTPGTQYTFSQTATRTATPAGLGAFRPEVVTSGFVGGLGRTFVFPAGTSLGPSFAAVGTVSLDFTNTTGRMNAFMGVVNDAPTGVSGEFDNAGLLFGFLGPGSFSRSTYVDYDNFGMRDSQSSSGSFAQVNGQSVNFSSGLLVNSKTVSAESKFPGVTFCQCEYTRWGFWSHETSRTIGSDTYQDMFHLGTWVAGLPTQAIDMPTTGVATYSGHVVASIKSSGNEYVAAGNFANAVDFGTRVGTVAVAGLDGRNYNGTVSYAPGGTIFAGNLTGTGLGAPNMEVIGQFYDGASVKAREMGGWVRIDGGPSYIGAGTFAASR